MLFFLDEKIAMNEKENWLSKALEHICLYLFFGDINISNFYLKSLVLCPLLGFLLFFFPQVPPKISLVTFCWCEYILTSWYKLLVLLESGSSFSYLIKLESCSHSQQWTALDCAKKVGNISSTEGSGEVKELEGLKTVFLFLDLNSISE